MRELSVPALATAPQVGGLADAVFNNAVKTPDRVQLGRKTDGRWQDVTAAAFRDQVLALAKGLLAQGIRFGDRVAIMSRTRYEWTLFDFALWTIGAQPVPVYPTASAEQLAWILHDTRAMGCVVEQDDHAMTLGSVIGRTPWLTRVWQLDAGAVEQLTTDGAHIEDTVVHRHRLAVTPEAVATVIYTSGTTGRPRGCVLTHANFMAECDNLIARWRPIFEPANGDQPSTLLFLPLAHVFGRMVEVGAIRVGARLGHQPEMNADVLLPDFAAFRPTFILAVPYVFERVFGAARRKAEKAGNLEIFDKAADVAVRYAEARERYAFGTGPGPTPALRLQHKLFDALVYSKLRAAMGGRVQNAVSGGSTMGRRLGLFFDGAGVTVYEGYGLTESTAAATANPPGKVRFGTVGLPVPGTTVRITDEGEIMLRGGTVFSGYLDDPEATAAALRDGWLATGDLGSMDEDGYLTITGRKKELIVTASGKNLLPSVLEDRVRDHPLVEHCVVVGNDRPYVTALVTLDLEAVEHWLTLHSRPALTPAELVRDPELQAEVRRAVSAANTQVSRAESIRAFRVVAAPFTEEEGLLTPSRKLKRRAVEEAHAAVIEAMYRR
ncbi:long-chain fatty acid--CoA ligase [Streptomyces piniterrae]|uniref:Long-chain fatty acid--CoA ligase n=1 Tax=Streptomyces piniterrae TaxID=2571125 RepID=A0A4U0N6V1_9ACTN|nr:AMP-dependent synthetase/ligase [Streptomyces piniterrae]TJZ49465.1 long-chain fatty acid--CoA ligase [Streptomyces piniterrae]